MSVAKASAHLLRRLLKEPNSILWERIQILSNIFTLLGSSLVMAKRSASNAEFSPLPKEDEKKVEESIQLFQEALQILRGSLDKHVTLINKTEHERHEELQAALHYSGSHCSFYCSLFLLPCSWCFVCLLLLFLIVPYIITLLPFAVYRAYKYKLKEEIWYSFLSLFYDEYKICGKYIFYYLLGVDSHALLKTWRRWVAAALARKIKGVT